MGLKYRDPLHSKRKLCCGLELIIEKSKVMSRINFLIVMLALFSCNQTKKNNEEKPDDGKSGTITLSVKPRELILSGLPDMLKVTMTNNTGDTISTGLHYQIEKLESGRWENVFPKDMTFPDIGFKLKPNGSKTFENQTFKKKINYTSGKYRMVKFYLKPDYQKTKESYTLYAEFNIN